VSWLNFDVPGGISMSSETEKLLVTVLALPSADRVEFVEALIASLRPEDRPPFDEAWRPLIERRGTELRSGSVKAVSWDAVQQG
jgi:putative addiction module component (TIGR02574 family)